MHGTQQNRTQQKIYLHWIRTALLVGVAGGLILAGLMTASAQTPDAQPATSPAGLWDATIKVDTLEIPFRFEIAGKGANLKGSFFDGDRRVTSTRGTFENGALTFAFDGFATTLQATLTSDGQLTGEYQRGKRPPYPFQAVRAASPAKAAAGASQAPSIAGVYTIPTTSSKKGEASWRFIVKQDGPEVSATILRVDGDTGTLRGRFADGKFVLSHFSGVRPSLLVVTPQADGSLDLLQNGKNSYVALEADSERAKAIGAPTDPTAHTRVKDAQERFTFAFPDLNGRTISDRDPRFANKVVLVSVTGSWCPNCHDEAPFLAKLYKKYRGKGLEIVAFSFEEEEQLANPTRLRAFVKQYGIEYTVLLAGEPDTLADKVPQAENLNSFPTTFVLGRDGRVRGVHAGFPSPASGEFYSKAEREITEQVEHLLAERVTSTATHDASKNGALQE